MAEPSERQLARLSGRQLGLVTSGQLHELGMSANTVRRRLRCGTLLRCGVRVFAVGGSPRSWERTALAACLDLGTTAALSHTSAAVLWRLDVERELPVHVTVAYGRNVARSSPGLVLHRTQSIVAAERARIGRLPVTSLTRTIVDLAAILSPDALTRVVDDALLPAPVVQQVVAGGSGFVARTDFAWPDRMLVLEVDGFRWHASPRAHARDSQRGNRLAALGWTVLHATPAELDTAVTASWPRCAGSSAAPRRRFREWNPAAGAYFPLTKPMRSPPPRAAGRCRPAGQRRSRG